MTNRTSIVFERLPAQRGAAWLRNAYQMLARARLPWLLAPRWPPSALIRVWLRGPPLTAWR